MKGTACRRLTTKKNRNFSPIRVSVSWGPFDGRPTGAFILPRSLRLSVRLMCLLAALSAPPSSSSSPPTFLTFPRLFFLNFPFFVFFTSRVFGCRGEHGWGMCVSATWHAAGGSGKLGQTLRFQEKRSLRRHVHFIKDSSSTQQFEIPILTKTISVGFCSEVGCTNNE